MRAKTRISSIRVFVFCLIIPELAAAQSRSEQCRAPAVRLLGAQTTFIGQALPLGLYVSLSPDAMLVVNPGYNRARSPAGVFTLRVRAAWPAE